MCTLAAAGMPSGHPDSPAGTPALNSRASPSDVGVSEQGCSRDLHPVHEGLYATPMTTSNPSRASSPDPASNADRASNRRRDPRVNAELEVEIHHDEGGVLATGRCRDISRGGMYVCTDRDVATGTRCRVRVHRHAAPILTPMCLWGQITRTDGQGLGVAFDGSDRELASFVASLFASPAV